MQFPYWINLSHYSCTLSVKLYGETIISEAKIVLPSRNFFLPYDFAVSVDNVMS